MTKITYEDAGVRYEGVDPYKIAAQKAGRQTEDAIKRFGFKSVPWSRGESAYLVATTMGYIGFVVEGLGTKSLVAAALRVASELLQKTGRSYYENVGQCNVAMAVNDLVTLGTRPVVYGQYLAVESDKWFDNGQRNRDLVNGTKKACELARCAWGCGETPVLSGIITSGTEDLAGATWGFAKPSEVIEPGRITGGDAIVIIESNGIHANGLSLARRIATNLPKLFLTELPDRRTFGETLLDPTHIYVGLVEDCLAKGVKIHGAVNVTGHGWRKFMRSSEPFRYVIETLPQQKPIFGFLQEKSGLDDKEMYATFNMGAGFALYVPPSDVDTVAAVAKKLGQRAFLAGHIEKSREKKVVIRPIGVEFSGEELQIR